MLFRALGLVGALLFVVAVGVGRMVPTELHYRVLGGTPPISLDRGNREVFEPAQFVDPATGRIEQVRLPARDVLENARCSPWTDEKGRRQVVGRWSEFSGPASDLVISRVGLARYSYPDGAALDRIETDIPPFRAPCWYPGTSARVLFSSGDGQLYQFAFESAAIGKDRPQVRPEPITVRPGVLESERVHLTSPCWPTERQLGGRLLVSVSNLNESDADQMSRSSLWWIRLNSAGDEVVEAGRVTEPALELAETSPTVGMASDGTLLLAYLGQRERIATWRLFVTPLHVDQETGRVWTVRSETVELAAELNSEPPVFSPDARYLTVQRPYWVERPGMARVALPSRMSGETRTVSATEASEADRGD